MSLIYLKLVVAMYIEGEKVGNLSWFGIFFVAYMVLKLTSKDPTLTY